MLESVLAVVKSRYPQSLKHDVRGTSWEFQSKEYFIELEDVDITVNDQWVEYMDIIAASTNTEHDEVSPSLLQMARNGHLEINVVTEYLGLLQDLLPSCPIHQPIIAGSRADAVVIDQETTMTLLPIQHEDSWLAAVAYPDIIHIYGLDKEGPVEPKVREWFSSLFPNRQVHWCCLARPSTREDSGLLMLLTIRMLMAGRAPARRNDTGFVRKLRAKFFVELLARDLNAGDEEVDRRLQAALEDTSYYFNEAFVPDNSPPYISELVPTTQGGTMANTPPTPVRSIDDQPILSDSRLASHELSMGSNSYSERPASQIVPPRHRANAQNRSEKTIAGSHPKASQIMPPSMPQECKTILKLLSEAVAFHRSSRLTINSDFASIWSSIKIGSKSEFYRRYNAVLFYEKMLEIRNDQEIAKLLKSSPNAGDLKEIRSSQARSKVWYDICQLRENWGQSKYTLLCVVPEKSCLEGASSQQKQEHLHRLQSRLEDNNDPFLGYIERAQEICCSLIECRLPQHWLMIDNYHLKVGWDMLKPEFEAYTSLDSNPKLEMQRTAG
ncbi:uncharacterized protein CCOS01_16572 [Colletotrichum costaricense]|uniref:Uncharacterized protein n=1 Tax=Colletotrichum costaricense TaxID=1209916 RepID=A0AAI9YFN2_9PEZI|nr:uncharacterized protein CCOS01_16572 [Colletotrichum costaricense]KAK1506520.1 hypothetical protein CCOS01_16572 [Colletotrichum costaricense]